MMELCLLLLRSHPQATLMHNLSALVRLLLSLILSRKGSGCLPERSHFPTGEMPDTPRSMASLIGHMFQLLTLLLSLTLLIYGDTLSFVVLMIPTVILLWMTLSHHKRDDFALLILKLAVLVQSVVLWLSLMTSVWESVDQSIIHDLYRPKAVKNSYSNQYVSVHDRTSIPKKMKAQERDYHRGDNQNGGGEGAESGARKSKVAYQKLIARHFSPPLDGEGRTALIERVFGKLPDSDFDDLKYRSRGDVRSSLSTIFSEIPDAGYLPGYKNPCWFKPGTGVPELTCLPYVYMLGMPKCGTSDL